MRKSKEQKANEAQIAFLREHLTEKGFRECMAKLVTLSPEYFRNGGTFNWMNYERK